MSTLTTYYSLVKPNGAIGGDFVDVTQLDNNFDTIDTALHNHDTHLTTLDATSATNFTSLASNIAQSIPNNAETALVWQTEVEDAQGFHAASSASIIVPANLGGVYLITAQAGLVGGVDTTLRRLNLNLNGVAKAQDQRVSDGTANSWVGHVSAILRLVPTDALQLTLTQASGAAKNTDLSAGIAPYFQMSKLGA